MPRHVQKIDYGVSLKRDRTSAFMPITVFSLVCLFVCLSGHLPQKKSGYPKRDFAIWPIIEGFKLELALASLIFKHTGAQRYHDTLANWNKVDHDKI